LRQSDGLRTATRCRSGSITGLSTESGQLHQSDGLRTATRCRTGSITGLSTESGQLQQRLRLGMRTRLMALMSLMLGGALVVRAEELKCPKPNGDFARPYKIVTQAAGGPSYVPPKAKKLTRPKYPDSAYK